MKGKEKTTVDVPDVPQPKAGRGSIRGLFTYADSWDILASVVASGCLCALGVSVVSFLFFLKPFFTDISNAESSGGGMSMDTVNFMAKWIIILGGLQFCCACPGFAVANISAARQKRAWQKAVVKSIMRQEIGWVDTSKPEELTSKVCVPGGL